MARLPASTRLAAGASRRPARRERQETVEQRLGVAAEQVLVVRLADAEIERVEPALAASAHQIDDQLLARAFDGVAAGDDRIEHGAEAAVADDAAHGGDDDVVDRERVKLDQRIAVGEPLGGRRLDEAAHFGLGEGIGHADASACARSSA